MGFVDLNFYRYMDKLCENDSYYTYNEQHTTYTTHNAMLILNGIRNDDNDDDQRLPGAVHEKSLTENHKTEEKKELIQFTEIENYLYRRHIKFNNREQIPMYCIVLHYMIPCSI